MKRDRYLNRVTAFVAAAALLPQPSLAQYNPLTPSMAYAGMARAGLSRRIGQDALRRSMRRPMAAYAGRAETIARQSATSLGFRPSVEVHRQILDRMALLAAQDDPARKTQAVQVLTAVDPVGQFDGLLRGYGYSGSNLADALTGYVTIAWEVVTGQDASVYVGGIRTVHDGLRAALSTDREVAALADAERQNIAETLAYLTIFALATRAKARQSNDTAALGALQSATREAAQRLVGADLSALQLTNDGFVAKR